MRDPQFFAKLEQDTKGLLCELATGWTEDELASVRADIGYGEWGLAIEQVVGAIVRLNKPLTADLLAKIDDLAARMNMTGSQHLRALHARAKRLGIDRRQPIARAG
jgi:hypothetical protein